MFRRRTAAPVTAATSASTSPAVTPEQLAEAGWVLPAGIAAAQAGQPPAWTLIGTVGSPTATAVDPAGLVVGDGWSLDWWIGGDDRWHVPAREAAVRQDLVDDAPVVETRLRIPGGDAVHRSYGIRSPRGTGDEWVVVEVENATPVPLAVAFVIRPTMADSLGSVGEITIEPVAGGQGRDVAHLVRVDGTPAVVLPRRPAAMQAGNLATGDAVDVVIANEAGPELVTASCPDGMATLAFIFPVPHTAVLRVLLPVGELDRREAVAFPSVVPDAATVASGWAIHRRSPRFEIPERRVQRALARARAHVLLAYDGQVVRRDGHVEPDFDPQAAVAILSSLDLLDRPDDVLQVAARWQERLAVATPQEDAVALTVLSFHWLLHRDDALLDWMLPEVGAAVERIDRADRKGLLADPLDRFRAGQALRLAARFLGRSGQSQAAAKVGVLADRIAIACPPLPDRPANALALALRSIALGQHEGIELLYAQLTAASPTGCWHGDGRSGRGIGHDLVASANLVAAVRRLLVTERTDELALLPVFPDLWYGGGVEAHDVPTTYGRLSFAIRWHGLRPALLWEFEPHPGMDPVSITVPGLDPTWSTTDLRGDALLAAVTPPEGIDLIREVAEHPGLQEHMRPEADEAPKPPPSLPEGGVFS